MPKNSVDSDLIINFLEGGDPQKYIVGVEATYYEDFVYLIINDPNNFEKTIEKHSYTPFLWVKQDVFDMIYQGKRSKIRSAMRESGIKVTKQLDSNADGEVPDRLKEGYIYLVKCKNGSYSKLINFFKNGGVDLFNQDFRKYFVTFSPAEQYLIQTKKRLFKGIEDYNDTHRLQFDLETEGLDARTQPIFQIGIKDNRGFEYVLEVKGDTPKEKRDSERFVIKEFFRIIDDIRPDIITGYNSENFDWDYFEKRCDRLNLDLGEIAITLDPNTKFKRKDSMLKLGGESENYKQTYMWGYNILDISHSVRRAQAINSSIKKWNLKYITQFSDVAKVNRVYIPGDILYKTWSDPNPYWFNDLDGSWGKLKESMSLPENSQEVKGDYIVQRYLLDDLWETEQIDGIYNQAAYLIAKLLPTTYMRSSTMGTAGQWKLIMAAWSYENGLAIPSLDEKKPFVGGLSRLLEVGYARNVIKLDFAALYPKTQLTHSIFPSLDISGVMEGLLTYIVDTRDKFKFLTGTHKNKTKELRDLLEKNIDKLSKERIDKANGMITDESKLASDYDKKQLPLKILANSFFGAYGAPYIFNWGDTDSAEETTCRGRQYLRLMVKFFTEKYGFRALVGDSITGRTPIYIKYNNTGEIDISPVRDIFSNYGEIIKINGQERDFNEKDFKVLTKSGWSNIEYVYRHKTRKHIHRIETSESVVECTSDHSLFKPSGKEVKPKNLKRGDSILTHNHNINVENIYPELNEDKAWLIGFFIADGSSVYKNRKIKRYFSKRKKSIVEHNTTRSEWTLSNSDYDKLLKAKNILLKEFGVNASIKDYRKSSNVYKLKTHFVALTKEFSSDCYCDNRLKKIPKKILNSTKEIKKSFLDGFCLGDGYGDTMDACLSITQKSQTVLAGIALLSKELGNDYRVVSRQDKPNVLNFNYMTHNGYKINNSKSEKKPDEVWNNYKINQDDNFVYDISSDGTFVAGIGNIICHNTDGFNFAIPDDVDTIKYVCKATHWKTDMYEPGTELSGLEAVLAEFNETYMIGRMGLDVDDICNSTINFARKNYANDINGKVKLVGNSIKSKAMPVYIEEFLDKGIRMLLDGNGYDFIDLYYKTVDEIFNYRIPVAKIASKSKVKMTPDNYKNVYCKQKTKAGRVKARQAHMELILHEEINVDLGDVIYYVNTGSAKSHSDVKKITDKATGKVEIQLNCKHIPQVQLENDPNLTTDEYNVAKYLDAFNKRIKPLLVCFEEDIRHDIIVDVYKDRKSKVVKLKDRSVFTEKQCKLIAGKPFNESDQDTYEALMRMEDKEIAFWSRVNKLPNNMEQDEWDNIKLDWKIRSEQEINDSISYEKNLFHEIIQRLEIHEINEIVEHGELYGELRLLGSIHLNEDSSLDIVSNKNNVVIGSFEDLFKFKKEAEERRIYYNTIEHSDVDLYQSWLDYQEVVNSGSTVEDITSITNEISNIEVDAVIINNEYIKEIEDYLINHKWEKGSDNQWVMDDWDYNKTGSITLEDAYELEKIKQKVLTEIKNSKVGDKNLVLKTPIEEEDIVEELEDDEEWNF
jgi:DNA polymerase elongation subunit (family B)